MQRNPSATYSKRHSAKVNGSLISYKYFVCVLGGRRQLLKAKLCRMHNDEHFHQNITHKRLIEA